MRKLCVWLLVMLPLGSVEAYTPHVEAVETGFGGIAIVRRFNPFDGGVCGVTARVRPALTAGHYAASLSISETYGNRSLSIEILRPVSNWVEREDEALLLAYIDEEMVEIIGVAYTREGFDRSIEHVFYTSDMTLLSATSDIHMQKSDEVGSLTFVLQHELIESTAHYFDTWCSNNPFFQTSDDPVQDGAR